MHAPFAARLTSAPIPFDADRGAEAVAALPGLDAALVPLVAGAGGCSPFLAGLVRQEAGWLAPALAGAPEEALAAALAAVPAAAAGAEPVAAALRQARRRTALIVALADLGGVWPLETVTAALTRLADLAVARALEAALAEELRRGRIPGQGPGDAGTGAGMVVIAMGKMGAGELNYSSDIDLVCLYDETHFDPADLHAARAGFLRVTRRMCALLSDLTADGYVFRTDLRLRPDAAVTPVCLSTEAAERYYEAEGRTWERAAYIKARPCAGDIAAGERFLAALTPFVWRRHLDFAAIQDAHDMRLRIRAHRGLHGPVTVEGHDLKLGAGGIREIEFFTQTRQLIAGGRDPGLRVRGTVEGLARLAARGWVPAEVATRLTDNYRAHRSLEHRLQMVNDAQTHAMPATAEGVARIARLAGEADTAAFRAALARRLDEVAALTEGFFAPGAAAEGPALSPAARAVVDRWPSYPALRTERARTLFRRIRPALLSRLHRAADPQAALAAFDSFLAGLPAGVQLFALFDANPQLVDLIADIAATAPGLARYLAHNAGVLDAVIGGDFFAPWPGAGSLRASLDARLATVADYERKLDAARLWAREWHFRIGVHHLRGLVDAVEAAAQYADLAEACLAALWAPCAEEFARRHGPPPGRGAMVLGMGSLGARRLNAASDVDLIVIYDPAGAEASRGPRPLASTAYYARLTKAFVTALAAPMAAGRLYAVDMRLRPSGRQGPVATALAAFRHYQEHEAWTWEHLALTRARPVAGDPALGAEVEGFRRALLRAKAGRREILPDVAEMRARLHAAKPPEGPWDVRSGPGRMQDIELVAQAGALFAGSAERGVEGQLAAGVRAGLIGRDDGAALASASRLYWRLHAGARLLTDRPLALDDVGAGATAFLLRETGAGTVAGLADRLAAHVAATEAAVARLLAAPGSSEALGEGAAATAATGGTAP
ncbi:MAG: glutamine-synthetase adenylyltransferase [Rhodobacteraceae bacterium]|jgi:glutamate-ammonia-ligase adenylyltransferase|nr:glutamine-synthetase adenylyltransferase [Paracoccaceae bacterium]